VEKKYITIPMNIITDNWIPPTAQILYGLIYSIHRIRGKQNSHTRNTWYASTLHTNERQIQRYLNLLRNKNYISVEYKRNHNGHIISRNILPLVLLPKAT
jgi:hypothetical protein